MIIPDLKKVFECAQGSRRRRVESSIDLRQLQDEELLQPFARMKEELLVG